MSEPAPLPWLGKPETTATTQTWSPYPATLSLRFVFDRGDYLRLMARHYRRIGGWGVAVAVLVPLLIAVSIHSTAPPRKQAFMSVTTWLPIWLVASIVPQVITTLLIVYGTAYSMRGQQQIVILSAEGVIKCKDPVHPKETVITTPWKAVRVVEEWNGGVYVQVGALTPMSVPASAFADTGEARLFADAMRVLHESRGDMGAVSDDARTRFAPPSKKAA